jgi:glycosyltransferase involved in cell wall biosynthesis
MNSTQPKAILLVGSWPSDTGYAWKMIEQFWIAIAQAFPNRRTILCYPQVRAVNPAITAAGIDVMEFSFDFRNPTALTRFCAEHHIGLIYLTDRPYTSLIYPRLRRCGVERIVIHDHTPGQRTRPSPIKRLLKSVHARIFGADAYIACSDQVLDRLITVGCLPPEKCHLARNGIDLSQFPQPNPTIRHELGLPPDAVLAVSCSRLTAYKRVSDIVDAAALLGDTNLHFIHVGDGPELEALQARIRKHRIDGHFTLLGRRDDVPQILSGCDIGVHASNGEVGLCLAILEFMASGLAVAVTNEPTVSSVIDHDVTGLTYEHGDCTALARALRTLATNPELRKRLGQAARLMTQSRYRIEATTFSVVSAIRSVLFM